MFNYTTTNTVGKNLADLINRNVIKHQGPLFPTRISHHGSKTPDIMISNINAYHNIHLKQGPSTSSDHLPLIATISAYPIQIPIKPRKQFAKANWIKYSEELADLPPPPTHQLTPNEIEELTDNWTQQITKAGDKHIPTLTHRVLPGIKPDQDILELEHEIMMYEHILQTFGHHQLTYHLLLTAKETLNKKYWQLYNIQWDEAINKLDMERDPTKFFTAWRRMSGYSKTGTKHIRDGAGQPVTEPSLQEELFRKYWTNVFRNDQEDHLYDQDNIELANSYLQNNSENTVPLPQADPTVFSGQYPQMSTEYITNAFNRMRPKAPGASGITSYHLKHLPRNMLLTYKTICNQSLSLGYIPKAWKHAIIIFIPKGTQSQYKVESHRPISLLETPGKVFDRFLNETLNTQLDLHNLQHPDQHGFRKHRGTHTALATFHETISNHAIRPQKMLTVTLRDVSKAFDKVWTDGLQVKLLQLPLPDPLVRIICNFLTDRTASIRIADHIGPAFPLLSGVPQGACLSPTLFNLYTSALTSLPPAQAKLGEVQNILYADDIT